MEMLNAKKVKQFVMDKAIFLVLLLLVVVIAIINPRILRLQVLRDILMMSSTKIIMALGMMFVILTGGVDLGGGRLVGMAAVISASMLQTADYVRRFYPDLGQVPVILPILLAVAVGTLFGMMNGLIVAKFKVPAFIATLSSMLIIYGINSIYFNMPPNNSQPIGGLRADFTFLGSGSVGFVPVIVVFAGIVSIIVWFVLNKTVFGKNVYAVGETLRQLLFQASTSPRPWWGSLGYVVFSSRSQACWKQPVLEVQPTTTATGMSLMPSPAVLSVVYLPPVVLVRSAG